jgi:hypothetical protein
MDHPVNPRDLKLHSSDQSCPTCGFKVPHEERCGYHRNAADINEAYIGIRCHFEAQRRVQISVRGRRPPPDGILRQLAI